MLKKKNNQPELSPEEALNKRVDAIMNPKSPDMPPLDIFKDAPDAPKASSGAAKTATAPEVSGHLLEKVDTEAPSQPVKPKTPSAKKIIPVTTASTPTPPPSTPAPAPKPAAAPVKESTSLDDQATDKAVDDIAAHEGDTILALQDAVARKKSRQAEDSGSGHSGLGIGWALLLLAAIVLFLLIVPYTRYTCRWPVGIRLRVITDILPSVCK